MHHMGKRATGIAGALALALGGAVPALAAPRRYASGDYAGRVSQAIPLAYRGSIGFSIRSGVLTALRYQVTMVCGKLLMAQVSSPPSRLRVAVRRDGSFSYAGRVGGAVVRLRGTVRGRRARGTFFESFHTATNYSCTMYAAAPFGAGLGRGDGGAVTGTGQPLPTSVGVGTVTGVLGGTGVSVPTVAPPTSATP